MTYEYVTCFSYVGGYDTQHVLAPPYSPDDSPNEWEFVDSGLAPDPNDSRLRFYVVWRRDRREYRPPPAKIYNRGTGKEV